MARPRFEIEARLTMAALQVSMPDGGPARGRRYRLAILVSHPIQYFSPLYRRLAREPEIDLTVYYCSLQGAEEVFDAGFGRQVKWDVPLLDGYRYVALPNWRRNVALGSFVSLINPGMIGELRRNRYDALWVHGYSFVTHLVAIFVARFLGIPVFYRAESSLVHDQLNPRPRSIRLLKTAFLRSLFKNVSAFLAIGTLSAEFYRHYGAPPEKIFKVPYTIDNEYYMTRAGAARAQQTALRRDLGIAPDAVAFVFAAKLIAEKRPLEVLDAYARTSCPDKALVIAGEGALRSVMEARVAADKIPGVHFLGFVNQSELPRIYGISDVFLRPDGVGKGDWGLTINDALASGLAVISSDQIGASFDLVRDGENGIVVRFGDWSGVVAAMQRMAADPRLCRRMGERSLEIISRWSNEECVAGVLAALRSRARPPRRLPNQGKAEV
jgi:glycosyltransferase involved in cell wall biosynthesis